MEMSHVKSNIPHVSILLATFNGMKYLPQQLSSIYGQIGVKISILAHDDGSTDGTLNYLSSLNLSGKISSVSKSNQIGSTRAFLNLLAMAPDADYFAFCDQDDLWEQSKLISLIELIHSIDKPAMAFSGRALIDSNDLFIGPDRVQANQIGIRNALIQNIVPGNTLVLNRLGRDLARDNVSEGIEHYDAWLYLLMTCFGHIRVSNQLLTKYRIHSENQIGIGRNKLSRILRIESSLNSFRLDALNVLRSGEKKLSTENKIILNYFLALLDSKNFYERVILLSRLRLSRKSKFHTILFNCYLAIRKS
jgi:glycosyltransferase involved in cell wall biosynthesis